MEAEGQTVDALAERIEPEPHLLFEWQAFRDLATDRPSGWGIGAIPWTSIDRYAERHGLEDADEYARLVRLIRAMDRAFLDWHAEAGK